MINKMVFKKFISKKGKTMFLFQLCFVELNSNIKNLTDFFTKKSIGGEVSINDLRDKEFSGTFLSEEEKTALKNYDKYRINLMNAQADDDSFNKTYR